MVDISDRIAIIRDMIDNGDYFCINRGRQYGKTTTLEVVNNSLTGVYTVISTRFEGYSDAAFATTDTLAYKFVKVIDFQMRMQPTQYCETLRRVVTNSMRNYNGEIPFDDFSFLISQMCLSADKPIVLLIDEADQAGNFDSFVKFLGLLRDKFLNRDKIRLSNQ